MSVMEDSNSFRRFAGVSAILAGLLAIASGVFGAAALGSDPGMVTNPESLLQVGVRGAGLLRWSLLLEMILGGAWWLGSGFLIRRRRPTLGIVTLLVGTAAWLDAFTIIFNLEPLFLVALSAVLLLIPVWTLWFGIDLLKRPA